MGNMKFKVGDLVRIKSIDWYNENKNEYGEVICKENVFVKSMTLYCDSILTIENKTEDYYWMKENAFHWTDEMIEGLVEDDVDLIPKFGEYSDNKPLDIPTMTTDFVKEHGLPCPEGFIFKDENGNVISATKIVLEKQEKEYPKTYEECCEILDITPIRRIGDIGYKRTLLNVFEKLLICRDAYWKIAGEEMGLGKPWEPDWLDDDTKKYIITSTKVFETFGGLGYINYILTFPTEEMRDAFYENFKELIEICKELL